jgi:uncharacterized membrane protein (UPF0127 family)
MKVLVGLLVVEFHWAEAAEVKFPVRHIQVGKHRLEVEVADTDKRRARGLMFRKSLPEGKGMLFVFPSEQSLSFWMKNTFIPLSIGFFDKNRKLVDVQKMYPVKEGLSFFLKVPRYQSSQPSMYALETNQGWFEHRKLGLGAELKFLTAEKSKSK